MSYSIEEAKRNARETAANIHLTLSVLYGLGAAFVIIVWGQAMWKYDEASWSGAVLVLALAPLLPLLIHYTAARGLRAGRPWARPLSIIIGALLLPGFPLGTILGAVILYQMLRKEWRQGNGHHSRPSSGG